MSNTAYIIGNGPSRRSIDLTRLQGDTWGCNALYRDFIPDYLIAVDKKMQDEIVENRPDCQLVFKQPEGRWPYNRDKSIWCYKTELCVPHNSGAGALHLATKHNYYTTIVLLGFDFGVENLYKGSPNYWSNPLPNEKMQQYISNVVIDNPKIQFIRVSDTDSKFGGLSQPHTITLTPEQFGEQ